MVPQLSEAGAWRACLTGIDRMAKFVSQQAGGGKDFRERKLAELPAMSKRTAQKVLGAMLITATMVLAACDGGGSDSAAQSAWDTWVNRTAITWRVPRDKMGEILANPSAPSLFELFRVVDAIIDPDARRRLEEEQRQWHIQEDVINCFNAAQGE